MARQTYPLIEDTSPRHAPAIAQTMFNFMEDCVAAAMRWG